MFRRVLSVLLIFGYCAGQLATLPHAHGVEPADHDLRPHLHAGWLFRLFADEAHAPHHHGYPSHHHGQGGRDHPPGRQPSHDEPQGMAGADGCEEHDADCVYVSDAVSHATPGTPSNTAPASGDEASFAPLAVWLDVLPDAALLRFSPSHAPPNLFGGRCARFLELRMLRI